AALPALAPAIASPDDRTREQAVQIWGDIRDRSMRPQLVHLLDDRLYRVRAAAVLGLAGLADPASIAPLAAVLARENEHPTVLTQAARGLRFLALKSPRATFPVARLVALLDHPHRGVREASVSALEEIGPAAVPALATSIARLRGAPAGP